MAEETKVVRKDEKPDEKDEIVEKVVTGKITKRKKNAAEKIVGDFIVEDLRKVATWAWKEVTVPLLKEVIESTLNNMVSRSLYGGDAYYDERRGKKKKNYSKMYDEPRSKRRHYDDDDDEEVIYRKARDIRAYENIIFESRRDVDKVLRKLNERIDSHSYVTVAYLYKTLGENYEYTDTDYGWFDLDDAKVVSCKDGWRLKMPKPQYLD